MESRRFILASSMMFLLLFQILSMAIPVHAAAADLVVESISLSNPNPSIGQKVKIIFTVRNAGDAKSQPFYSSVSIDGSFFYEQSHGDTHEGNSITESTKFWEYNGGSHIITVCTDSRNNNAEPNESNCKSISVGGPTPKVSTSMEISVCPSSGSGYDCQASLTSGSNTQIIIQGALRRSDTQEGLSGRIVQLSWPGGATVVTTAGNGGYSYTTTVSFSSSASFVASFGGDSGYESSSNSKTVGVSAPPPPPQPPATEICNNGIDDDGDGYVDEGCYVPPTSQQEVCNNGIDDDGDGYVDEGCYVPQADVSIRLRSDAEDGSKDLGQVIFDGTYYTLPTTIYKKPGTYSIQAVPYSGYVFKQWDVGTPASSRNSPSTSVTISGTSVIVEMELRKEPVVGTFHFSMASSPGYKQVKPGETASFSIPVTLTSGPSQSVSLSVSGPPSSVGTASLSQTYGNPSFTPTLTVSTYSSASPGTYYVTVSGSGGGESQQATVKIEILSGNSGTTSGGTQTGTTPGTTQPGTTQPDTSSKSSTSLGSFAVTQREYQLSRYESTEVKMNGNINDYSRGKPIDLAVRKPDGSTQSITIYATKDGLIMTSILLDKYSPSGIYNIDARYSGSLLGSVSFNVKSASEPVVAAFDFGVRLNTKSIDVQVGQTVEVNVQTSTTSGSPQIISLYCTSTSVDCKITPQNIRSGKSAVVKIIPREAGEQQITVTGSFYSSNGNQLIREAVLKLVVKSNVPESDTSNFDEDVAQNNIGTEEFIPITWGPKLLPAIGWEKRIRLDIKATNNLSEDVLVVFTIRDQNGGIVDRVADRPFPLPAPLATEIVPTIIKAKTTMIENAISHQLRPSTYVVTWEAYRESDKSLSNPIAKSDEKKFSLTMSDGYPTILVELSKAKSNPNIKQYDLNHYANNAYFYPIEPNQQNRLKITYNEEDYVGLTGDRRHLFIFIPSTVNVLSFTNDQSSKMSEVPLQFEERGYTGKWYKLEVPGIKTSQRVMGSIYSWNSFVEFAITNPSSGVAPIYVESSNFADKVSGSMLKEVGSKIITSALISGMRGLGPSDFASIGIALIQAKIDYEASSSWIVLDTGTKLTDNSKQKPKDQDQKQASLDLLPSDQPKPAGVSNMDIKAPKTVQPNKKTTITVSGYYNPGIGGGSSYPTMKVTGTLYEKDSGFDDDSAGQCTSPTYTIEAHPPIGFPQDTRFECKFTVTPSTFVKEFFEGKETEWFAKILVKVSNGFDKSYETKTISIGCPKCK